MPIYEVQGPDGRIYEVEGPAGASEAQVLNALRQSFLSGGAEPEQPKEQGSWMGDLGRSFASGAVGATGALTSVFGADNAASRYLAETGESLQKGLSTARQAELQAQAARMKKAEESGSTWEEVKAGLLNVLEAPIQTTASALGSFAPMVATLPLAKIGLGARAVMAVRGAIGGAQGAGAVKQNVYEAVLDAELVDGKTPEEAQAAAARAQSYVGENLDQILLGGGLGVAAGATGAERLLPGGVRAQAGAAQQALTKRIGERAATGLTAAAGEMPLEALQGGQERLAANLALQRTGRDVDAFTGVAGQAAQEALAGGLGGAALGVALPDRSMSIAARKAEEERRAQEAKKEADYKASDEYALDIASKYEQATQQLQSLQEQKRKIVKNSPAVDEDREHNTNISNQIRALRQQVGYDDLKAQYQSVLPRLNSIEAARFTEAERNAPTAAQPYFQSPQATIPGLDAVEEQEAEAEIAIPERLMEQRQYLDRLLEDNQERMSTAAANADVNAIKTLEQQRNLIKADAAALDERLKATGFVDTAGQTQQLQQEIAKALQKLRDMAGDVIDPDKAVKLANRIKQLQDQLAEVGGDQQGLDLGAPRKLPDPVASANKYYKENTKRILGERQDLLQQQQTLPDDEPDLFAEQQRETAEERLVEQYFYDQKLGFVPSMLEKATAGTEPDVAAPEGVEFSDRAQYFLQRLDDLDKKISQAKTPQERDELASQRAQISSTSDADPGVRIVNELRSDANDALMTLEELSDMLREGRFLGSGRYDANKQDRADLARTRNELAAQLAAEQEQFANLTDTQQPETQRISKDEIAAQRTRIGQLEQELASIQQQLDVPESGVTTRQALTRRAEEAKQAYIQAVLQEAAALRRIRGEKGVTLDEALKAADKINTELDELITRAQAVREVEEVITQPAQMRGTKIVSPAKTEMRDTRPLEQRPFGKYRAALGTVLDGVEKTRQALLAAKPRAVQKKVVDFDRQYADREAERVAEERGEKATTLGGELRRRAEFVRNKMGRMQLTPQNVGKTWLATRNALNKAADAIDSGAITRDLLDAVEPVVDAVLSKAEVKPVDLRAIQDALAAMTETPAEQRQLEMPLDALRFVPGKEKGEGLWQVDRESRAKRTTSTDDLGYIRATAKNFQKAPAVVQARAAADKAREEAKKVQGVINQKTAAARALQAIRSRIGDLENKINATLERTKPAARSADSFFSLSKNFVTRMSTAELAQATPERRAEYAAALQVEAQYQAMRQEFDEKFKREGAASRAAVAPLQETKAVLDKQEKAFAKRISDLELALKDPALVAASKARAEAKDVLASKEAELAAQVTEQRADLQLAMDNAIAALKPAFEAVALATNPSVVAAKKALDAAEAALDKTREQISAAGDIGASLKFAFVYDQQRKDTEQAKAALEDVVAKAQADYDKKALIVKAYQDGLVKVELAALNRLEKRLANVRKELGEASPEARAAQQEMAAQQKVLDIAEAQQREAREKAAKQQRQYDERMQKGFGLPFARRVDGKVEGYREPEKDEAEKIKERIDRLVEDTSRIESGVKAKKAPRAIGPAARSQSAAPSAMRTGSAESREGQSRTQSDMRMTEARGEKQIDVAVSSKEMQEANSIAAALLNKTPKQKADEAREAAKLAKELEKIQRETEKAFSKAVRQGAVDDDFAVFDAVDANAADTFDALAPVRAPARKTLISRDAEGKTVYTQVTREQAEALGVGRKPGTAAALANASKKEAIGAFERLAGKPFDESNELNGKSMVEVARIFEKRARTPWRKQVFAAVADTLEALPVQDVQGRVFVTEGRLPGRIGFYATGFNGMVLTPGASADIVLHELVHAASSNALYSDSALFKRVDALRQKAADWFETKEGKAFYRKNQFGLNSRKAELRAYGLKNAHEFLAEALSNRTFQEALASIPTDTPVAKNLFKRFVDVLAEYFGLDKAGQKTVLAEALAMGDELFSFTKAHIAKYDALPNAKAKLDVLLEAPGGTENDKAGLFERTSAIMSGVIPNNDAKYNANVPESMRKSFGGVDQRSKTFGEKLSTWALGLRVKGLDAWGAREALVQMGLSGKKLTETDAMQTRIYMRLNSEVNRFVHQALLNGPLKLAKDEKGYFGVDVDDKKPSVMKVLQTLRGAAPDIGNMQAVEEQFYKYMQIKRIEGDKRGFEVLNMRKPPTAQEIREQKEFIAKHPKVQQAFAQAEKEFREYNAGMLDFAHAAGVFTDKEWNYFKSGNYVPFYRQTENGNIEMLVGNTRRTIGNVIQQPQLKDLVGGEKDFLGFTESVMQNAQLLTRMSLQNLQARDVGYMVQSLGMGTIVEGEGPANSIRFKQAGKSFWVKLDADQFPKDIPAELLLQGLHGIKASVPTALKIAGIPTQILRTSIVRMPLYMIRQMIRDPLHAWMVTGLNFTPIVSSIKEMTKIRRGLSPTEMKLMRSGAVSSNVMTGDFNDASRTLRDLANQGGMSWSSAMQSLDNFALQGDTATRAVLYDKYREQGMSHFEAALGAAEVMNFSRRGTSTSLYMISTLIPFFNAQLQGLDSVWRTGVTGNTVFQDKLQVRQKLYQRAALMMGITLAYAVAMQDDEAYKNATPEERAMNWFIPVPGLGASIRIPIPFEVGAVSKAIPELLFNAAFNDAESKDTLKGLRHVLGMSVPGDIPTIAKPIIESMANYSFFTKAPIESQRELGTIPAERYRPNTTELAKLMGQVGVSPLQVEHLVRGYTGSLGILAMSLANPILRPFNSDTAGEKAERKLTEMPFFGAAFQPDNGRGIVASVYADVEDWQQAAGTFKRLVTDGRQAEARAFADKYAREIALSSTGGSFQQAMGELAAMRRAINSDPDLSAAEKRERLDEIDVYQRKLAEQVKEVARMTK